MALIECPECKQQVSDQAKHCIHCGYPLQEKETTATVQTETEEYKPIYTKTYVYGEVKVMCPKCKSDNCSSFYEKQSTPDTVKTVYKANINPLKPLTVMESKEKVTKGVEYQKQKFRCNKCGFEFNSNDVYVPAEKSSGINAVRVLLLMLDIIILALALSAFVTGHSVISLVLFIASLAVCFYMKYPIMTLINALLFIFNILSLQK